MGFHGTDGFSVYDAAGALAFRVDNYSRRRKVFAGELLLMDGQGSPLLALRPQVRPCREYCPGHPSAVSKIHFEETYAFDRSSCESHRSTDRSVMMSSQQNGVFFRSGLQHSWLFCER
jgi:hypothetical protein